MEINTTEKILFILSVQKEDSSHRKHVSSTTNINHCIQGVETKMLGVHELGRQFYKITAEA